MRRWPAWLHFKTAAGSMLVGLICLAALLGPLAATHDPVSQNLPNRAKPPSAQHLMGTDGLGRDIFSRAIFGARISMAVGLGAVLLGGTIGLMLGVAGAYARGWTDVLMGIGIDIMMAFPLYLLAILIMAILGGSSVQNTVLAVGIASIPSFARLARGQALGVLQRDYITAARSLGAGTVRLLVRHVLPNISGPLLVMATLRIGTAILVDAGLSFIGLGVAPPTPSWGVMVAEGMSGLRTAPWISLMPSLAVTVAVLGFNLLGDGIRDVLDPSTKNH